MDITLKLFLLVSLSFPVEPLYYTVHPELFGFIIDLRHKRCSLSESILMCKVSYRFISVISEV
jgi:hypothetical protein